MTELEKKKVWVEKWWLMSTIGGVLQTCNFAVWVVVLLVVTSAPIWAWLIGLVYVFSHIFHFLTWMAANISIKEYRELRDTEDK